MQFHSAALVVSCIVSWAGLALAQQSVFRDTVTITSRVTQRDPAPTHPAIPPTALLKQFDAVPCPPDARCGKVEPRTIVVYNKTITTTKTAIKEQPHTHSVTITTKVIEVEPEPVNPVAVCESEHFVTTTSTQVVTETTTHHKDVFETFGVTITEKLPWKSTSSPFCVLHVTPSKLVGSVVTTAKDGRVTSEPITTSVVAEPEPEDPGDWPV